MRGAVAFVIVHPSSSSAARLHRQPRLACGRAPGFRSSTSTTNDRMGGGIQRRDEQCPLSFAANFGRSTSSKMRTRCGASRALRGCVAPNRRLTPTAFASIRPVQSVASPVAGRASDRPPAARRGGKRLLAGLARLVAGEPVDTLGHEWRLPSPDHGFDLPERRMISATAASAVARMMWARHTCSAARCGPRRSPRVTTIRLGDSHDNACSSINTV